MTKISKMDDRESVHFYSVDGIFSALGTVCIIMKHPNPDNSHSLHLILTRSAHNKRVSLNCLHIVVIIMIVGNRDDVSGGVFWKFNADTSAVGVRDESS